LSAQGFGAPLLSSFAVVRADVYAPADLADPSISISKERIVFDGPLGKLRPHSHAVLALLVGLERTFELETERGSESCAVAVVPAGVEHVLNFHGKRALVIYVEPHDPSYAAFHRGAAGACPSLPRLDAAWRRALSDWTHRQDCRALLALSHDVMATPTRPLDRRVRELAASFNRGLLLDAPADELGASVQLSASRLVHLLKTELGVGIRRLKQHYRFKLVAAAATSGQSLTTAAHAAGFADSGHFSRSFLETFGISPSQVLLRAVRGERVKTAHDLRP
jgi:AraC-like DNA-binding protein